MRSKRQQALVKWGKRAALVVPMFVLAGLLAPWGAGLITLLPVASKATEVEVAQLKPRMVQVEQRAEQQERRIDIQERIATQREILKLEEETSKRRLTEGERNYLRDLTDRLEELKRRK